MIDIGLKYNTDV